MTSVSNRYALKILASDFFIFQEQIHEMESELERFNKSNTNLELELSELKQKLSASNIELQEERLRVKDCRTLNSRILAGLHEAVDSLQEPAKMRSIVKTMYEKYGRFAVGQPTKKKGQKIGQDLDAEVELVRQREYLEKNLKSIREKLKRDHELHRQENLKVLQDNNVLLQEINVLRRELKISRADTSKLETKLKLLKRREKKVDEPDTVEPALLEKEKTIELQQSEIARLSAETSKLRKELDRRPTSGSRLPPME
jgi:cilia- and flagella-associated protein 57